MTNASKESIILNANYILQKICTRKIVYAKSTEYDNIDPVSENMRLLFELTPKKVFLTIRRGSGSTIDIFTHNNLKLKYIYRLCDILENANINICSSENKYIQISTIPYGKICIDIAHTDPTNLDCENDDNVVRVIGDLWESLHKD